MPLPRLLPGALAAVLAAAPLFAFTPAEEKAIAFVKARLSEADAASTVFSFDPSPCPHNVSAYSLENKPFEVNARSELVWQGPVGPLPTGPFTPRGTLFATLEAEGRCDLYTLTLSDTDAALSYLQLPSAYFLYRITPKAKVWSLPVAEAEEILLTVDALMRLHAPYREDESRVLCGVPGRLTFSFTEAAHLTPRFDFRNCAYITAIWRMPEVGECLPLGLKSFRSRLLSLYFKHVLTPPDDARAVPFEDFANAQLEQACARPGSVPDPVLKLCAQHLAKAARHANARFAQLLEQRLGLPAPEALQLIAMSQPLRDTERAECDRALVEGWIATLPRPTPEQWLALLRLAPANDALILEAAAQLDLAAPDRLEAELIAAFSRPGANCKALWMAMETFTPHAALTLLNHPLPQGEDPLYWTLTYLEYFIQADKPEGVLSQHRLDTLTDFLCNALLQDAVPSFSIPNLINVLDALDRLPDEATRLQALEVMLAPSSDHLRNATARYNAAIALAQAMLKRGSRAEWERVKPIIKQNLLGDNRRSTLLAGPPSFDLIDLLPADEASAFCRELCQNALSGGPTTLSLGDVLVIIVRYRLADCLPLLRPYAAAEGEPDPLALTTAWHPAQPLNCPPSVIVRDFLQAFPDEAAFEAFLNAHRAPYGHLDFRFQELYQWLQQRSAAQ